MQIRASDHETTVTARGTRGPAVVLVHSLGLDRRMWDPVLDRLATGRRVFAYDVRGHGSAAGAPLPFTMAATGADLVAVLDALELGIAHVAGLSLGGAIAQTAAVAAPGRFASLTLLGAPDRPVPAAFEDRARIAETEGMAALVGPTLERWFTAAGLAADTEGVRYARECLASFDPVTWASIWRGYGGLDVFRRLRGFPAPALALAGEADASITIDGMAAVASRIGGGAKLEVVPGAPHIQPLERPDEVADALDRFLPAEIDIP
ncbi:alpha/beta fold hydrolase [Amycolatopsis sp. FBCC-B4732]|uniref:alpha/beta fold hydrolase n=1 Tax=unclassified Amycolatopsis TaxID=2618356 RepID=UPI001FF67D85|nr:alpha/beta fold hydrolase [Amycolatopsis sp. FBCC-B4732]UOX91610.1 alpha/beta fold hydrolase [Amycolatopsis sp. FBCC-B4732]